MTGFVDPSRRRPSLAVLIAVSMVNPLALNIFVPSMPGMEHAFNTSYANVQLALSFYLAAVAIAQLVIGPLSDRFGRRPVLLAGMGLFMAGSLLCRLAPSIDVLIVGRVIQGAGGCAGLVLSRAIVRDLYDRDRAASMIGFVTMGMAVAPTLGPAIGGALDEHYGWTATFDLLLGFGLVVTLYSWASLHETHFSRQRGGLAPAAVLASFADLWRIGLFRAFALSSAFTSMVFFAFLGGAPYVVQKLMGIGPREAGLYFMSVAFGYILGNFISGRYATRFGVVRMLNVGNAISLGACLLSAAMFGAGIFHPVSVFGPMLVLGFGNGISLPSAIAGAVSVRPDLAGAASGLVGSLQIGGGAIVTVIIGHALDRTPWPLVGLMILLASGAMVTGLFVRRP